MLASGCRQGIVQCFAVSGTNIFSGTNDGGVFLSTNNGSNWINKNQGFNFIPTVSALLVTNGYVFAGTSGQSVWRRLYSEAIGIQNISTEVPSSFSLGQNYPNPFNPTTNVQFSMCNVQFVTLKIFDMLGREVATLVNKKLNAGTYSVDWNASEFPSGIYFYRLQIADPTGWTEGYTEVKKMSLIK